MNRRQLDAGGGVALDLFELVGSGAGLVVALLAGVHGDEPEGILAARLLLGSLEGDSFEGTVLAVPVANPAAVAADTRLNPQDEKNLARVFPGSWVGSPSEGLARVISDELIAPADLLIDLHSAGRDYEMPLFVGFSSVPAELRERAALAAYAMGLPVVWEHSAVNPGRSLSAASALGVPSIYVEASGGGAVRAGELHQVVAGLRRVLAALGMLTASVKAADPPVRVFIGDDGDTDASLSTSAPGSCIRHVEVGQAVGAGDLLASIIAEDGRLVDRIISPRDGVVMMLRRRPAVVAGDNIAMLGPRAHASG